MFLRQLVNSGKKNYKNVFVKGICFDSRKVKRDDIFFAIKGEKVDGNKFVSEAFKKKSSLAIVNDIDNKLQLACSRVGVRIWVRLRAALWQGGLTNK